MTETPGAVSGSVGTMRRALLALAAASAVWALAIGGYGLSNKMGGWYGWCQKSMILSATRGDQSQGAAAAECDGFTKLNHHANTGGPVRNPRRSASAGAGARRRLQ